VGRGGCTGGRGDARASCASPLGTPLILFLILSFYSVVGCLFVYRERRSIWEIIF
jgi:hypothetical protein